VPEHVVGWQFSNTISLVRAAAETPRAATGVSAAFVESFCMTKV